MGKNVIIPKGDIEIGKRIKILREENSLTQKQLAEMVMISPSSITRLEAGKTMVSVFTMIKIAEALKVSIADILETSDNNRTLELDLLGLSKKLNHCSEAQRKTLIHSFEQIVDSISF